MSRAWPLGPPVPPLTMPQRSPGAPAGHGAGTVPASHARALRCARPRWRVYSLTRELRHGGLLQRPRGSDGVPGLVFSTHCPAQPGPGRLPPRSGASCLPHPRRCPAPGTRGFISHNSPQRRKPPLPDSSRQFSGIHALIQEMGRCQKLHPSSERAALVLHKADGWGQHFPCSVPRQLPVPSQVTPLWLLLCTVGPQVWETCGSHKPVSPAVMLGPAPRHRPVCHCGQGGGAGGWQHRRLWPAVWPIPTSWVGGGSLALTFCFPVTFHFALLL